MTSFIRQVEIAPPTSIDVTRKQKFLEPKFQGLDELYLSIFSRWLNEEVKKDKALKLAHYVSGYDDVMCTTLTVNLLSIYELSVPDFSSDDSLPAATG